MKHGRDNWTNRKTSDDLQKSCARRAVVLDESVSLRDGATVRVVMLEDMASEPLHPDIVRFTGILPPDIDVRAEYVVGMEKKHE